MKRLLPLLATLAAVATVFVALPSTPPAAAAPVCICGLQETTPAYYHWSSAGCNPAGLEDFLRQKYLNCHYGTCRYRFVLTEECIYDTYNGLWRVRGYITFRCWEC